MANKRPFNGDPLPIPPRWLKCPRKGLPIISKFIPFKTPLDSKYDDQVPEEDRFTLDFLIMSLASKKVQLGSVWNFPYQSLQLVFTPTLHGRPPLARPWGSILFRH
jgi:hypothetical protein